MKLFYVGGRYTPKGCRKARGQSGCVIAETEEEAIEKFKSAIAYHKDEMIFSAWEEENGICVVHSF